MDEKKLYSKLDKIGSDIVDMKVIQAVHTEQMTEHMRRTSLLETAQAAHEQEDHEALETIDKKLEPMDDFLNSLKGIKYLIWFVGVVLGIILALSKL